jgi:hypothetical protein
VFAHLSSSSKPEAKLIKVGSLNAVSPGSKNLRCAISRHNSLEIGQHIFSLAFAFPI